MLIEYKITVEKNGLTITQRFEPGTSTSPPADPVQENSLKSSYQASQASQGTGTNPGSGGAPGNKPGGGGGGPDDFGAPITIIGPIVLGCCPLSSSDAEAKA